MKRGLLWMVGGALALCGFMWLAGTTLPVQHTAAVRASYERPAAEVWETIANAPEWPSWNSAATLVTSTVSPEGRQVWVVSGPDGDLPLEVLEMTPPSVDTPGALATRIVGEDLPFGGVWVWEVAPAESGCVVTLTERGEVYSPLFRFLSAVVFGHHGSVTRFLVDLGRKFQDNVLVERVTP